MSEMAETLLAMVAVHQMYPQMGGLSDEQRAAIAEWYENYRQQRLAVPQNEGQK